MIGFSNFGSEYGRNLRFEGDNEAENMFGKLWIRRHNQRGFRFKRGIGNERNRIGRSSSFALAARFMTDSIVPSMLVSTLRTANFDFRSEMAAGRTSDGD